MGKGNAKVFQVTFGAPGLSKTKRRMRVAISRKKFKSLDEAAELFEGMRINVVLTRADSEGDDEQRGQERLFREIEDAKRKLDTVADVAKFDSNGEEVTLSLQMDRKSVSGAALEHLAFSQGLMSVEVLGLMEPPKRKSSATADDASLIDNDNDNDNEE